MIYKTFKEWKAGRWLEDGEPRTEAYTEDELLLVEMGWKYGFDAGKEQTKPLTEKQWMYIYNNANEGKTWISPTTPDYYKGVVSVVYMGKIEVIK